MNNQLLAFALNHFGGQSGRPHATVDNLEFFTASFKIECLGRVTKSRRVSDEARATAATMMTEIAK